ncbi:Hypothetical_protein [Hexamita inflata]|uniref:Hypothetical_protein n=1 Tax=Hexamita inflata TaxID=28002 RepID=A0AA86UK56_9EUKA|nr:Hypothetical protein HINF_LOCUS46589 [Hexamita inflata]
MQKQLEYMHSVIQDHEQKHLNSMKQSLSTRLQTSPTVGHQTGFDNAYQCTYVCQKRREENLKNYQRQFSYKPVINANTDKLLSSKNQRPPKIQKQPDQPSFKPTIFTDQKYLQQLKNEYKNFQKKPEIEKPDKELLELKQCTFKPEITAKARAVQRNFDSVIQESQIVAQKKLMQQRQEQIEKTKEQEYMSQFGSYIDKKAVKQMMKMSNLDSDVYETFSIKHDNSLSSFNAVTSSLLFDDSKFNDQENKQKIDDIDVSAQMLDVLNSFGIEEL